MPKVIEFDAYMNQLFEAARYAPAAARDKALAVLLGKDAGNRPGDGHANAV